MAKNKNKKRFIINNLLYSFVYFLALICFIMGIFSFILSLNIGIIVYILLISLLLLLASIALFFVIKEHISEIKEYKFMLLKKELLSSKNSIGTLGEGKCIRLGDDNYEKEN